jgi:hypothetical protein
MTKTTADTELIAKAVELACRAPSLHNTQPWRWVATKTNVDLFADPHRVVRSSDSAGREAIIGCGAALDHFRVAMAAAGWNTAVEEFPNPNNSTTSHRSTSRPWTSSRRLGVIARTRFGVGGPIGFRSGHLRIGSRLNRRCGARWTMSWSRSTC